MTNPILSCDMGVIPGMEAAYRSKYVIAAMPMPSSATATMSVSDTGNLLLP